MAAALLKRRRPTGHGRIIRSAGIEGSDGHPVHLVAQEVIHRRGIDLSYHRARIATPNLLPAFDLILAMQTQHRKWVEQNAPASLERTWLLGHWRDLEIHKPINGHHPDYERIADDIDQCLTDWLKKLQDLATLNGPHTSTSNIALP
jgi:protein-tyrosine phosphatase